MFEVGIIEGVKQHCIWESQPIRQVVISIDARIRHFSVFIDQLVIITCVDPEQFLEVLEFFYYHQFWLTFW
jgi:hypothetical protein